MGLYEEMREKNRRQRSGEALEEGRGRRRREPEAYERRKLKEGRRLRRRRSRRKVSGCGSADSVSVRRSGGMVSERKPHQRAGESLVCGDA